MIAENGVTTEFVTFNGLVLGGYDKSGEQTEHYYYGTGLIAAERKAGNTSSMDTVETSLYYYLKNSHGDVIGLTDSAGTLTETYRYDVFGTLSGIRSLNEKGVLAEAETALSRFLYAGEQYDDVTGLYYLRARFYDTMVGRFTQEDTYLGDGRNLYAYVRNNPLKYVDPSGHCSKVLGYDKFKNPFMHADAKRLLEQMNQESYTIVELPKQKSTFEKVQALYAAFNDDAATATNDFSIGFFMHWVRYFQRGRIMILKGRKFSMKKPLRRELTSLSFLWPYLHMHHLQIA